MGTPASSARRNRRPSSPIGAQIASCGRWLGPRAAVATGTVAFGQDPACADLPARVVEADPVGEPGSDLEVFVARELSLEALQDLGRAVVLQAEDDPVAGLLPRAQPIGLGDPVELLHAVRLGPPERQVAVLPPPRLGEKGREEPVHPDQVPEALELSDGERLVGPPARPVGVLAPFDGDHHGAQLVEHVVVRGAGVAVVDRLEAVHEPELVERGQAVLGGVQVVEVHLSQVVGREHPVAIEHGQDDPVPLRQPVRHRHHEPVGGPRPERRSSHENNPKESGFATGGGGVATRWHFARERVLRSGLATSLAGVLATTVATRWIPLTPSTPHGGPWCAGPRG